MKKRWYDYLWIASSVYFLLGFVNILFAWLGLVCFFLPLIISVAGGGKAYCNRYCGRGQWAYHGETVAPWAVQFSFGFYSIMLTSTVLGIITMAFFKPRSWCVYCPMGTMTQLICKAKAGKSVSLSRNDAGNTCTIQSE